jgi:aldehyde:ferredoxin oxidoreductase
VFGRLLKIDLTSKQIEKESIRADWVKDFIGGSGLAARMLWETLDPEVDPLSPENPMLWITGPLTGSAGPTTGRFTICARSPQTGIWGESNIGGFVGPELRFAGFDALWITGKSPQPVYIWIHNGEVEIRSAEKYWGVSDTYETQKLIKAALDEPNAKVACIGTAGENLVPYSLILSDHGRVAGRTGMGAVMGSKNLKALAIRGTGKIPFYDQAEYSRLRVQANKDLLQQNMTDIFHSTGTSGAADYLQMVGDMPQKYWSQATFEGAGKVSGAEMAETILTGTTGCQGCVIRCGREVTIKDGPYSGPQTKGPEYETICSFGPQLLVDDLAVITALGERCDRLGLDSISAGNTIALAYLMFEKGFISKKDTGGIALTWGDASPCFDFLDQIAGKAGFGAKLALGSKNFAGLYGAEDLAVQVNNLDVAMHDPRGFSGQAIPYVTSPRGACHNQGDYFSIELGGSMEDLDIPMTDRFTDGGKAQYIARHQHWRTVCNSLVMCFFAVVPVQTVCDLLNAAEGGNWDIPTLIQAGERAWNLKRLYNGKLGLTRETEKLPKLLLQSLPDGGQEGHVPDMEILLQDYYAASGWDTVTGMPTQDKQKELGLP